MDIVVSMLPVGQGAMNLIEFLENNHLSRLYLVDGGSEDSRNSPYCRISMEYVVAQMIKRFANGDGICFDVVILTHRDSDHWNLVPTLFQMMFGNNFAVTDGNIKYYEEEQILDQGTLKISCSSDGISFCNYERTIYLENIVYTARIEENAAGLITKCRIFYSNAVTGIYMKSVWDVCQKSVGVYINDEKNPYICRSGEEGENLANADENTAANWYSCNDTYMNICSCSPFLKEDAVFWYLVHSVHDVFIPSCKEVYEKMLSAECQSANRIHNLYVGGNPAQNGRKFQGALCTLKALTECYCEKSATLFENLWLSDPLLKDFLWGFDAYAKSSNSIVNNASSVVSLLYVNNGERDIPLALFPGDATSQTFFALKNKNFWGNAANAVWAAPHHGSYRTMQTDENIYSVVLKEAKPSAIVISAGYKNRYGHPHFGFLQKSIAYYSQNPECQEPHDICFNGENGKSDRWFITPCCAPVFTTLGYGSADGQTINFVQHFFHFSDRDFRAHFAKPLLSMPNTDYIGIASPFLQQAQSTRIPDAKLFLKR